MGVTFKWNKPIAQIAKDATGGDATLKFMASEARRLMNPYVPMDTGTLADTVDVYTEGGKGVVHYRAPYAQRQYNGDGNNFSKEKHPKATAQWDKAMQSERGADLAKAVQAFIKKGGG